MSQQNKHNQVSDLEKYFKSNDKRLIHKWSHYFDIYERHFSKYRDEPIVLLEIGIFHGGSLQMWKDYFGDQVQIIGVDINPECKSLEEERISIHIGSQSDRKFLRELKSKIPKVDILIDDGGHNMKQQIITFNELYDHVKEDGIYLCEDTHSSYILEHGGGLRRRGTFIEFSKKLVDHLHAFHSREKRFGVTPYTESMDSIHFYDSIVLIEKKKRKAPKDLKSGKQSYDTEYHLAEKKSIKRLLLRAINKTLLFFRLPGFIWK